MDRDIPFFGHFFDMGIELISEDPHDPIGQMVKAHCSEEFGNTCRKEERPNITSKNHPVEAEVVELDI
jgi:hypothetical protein